MSLAAPAHQLSTGSAVSSCPPSPTPVVSMNSTFFQSPFSSSSVHQTPRNVQPNFCGPLLPNPICVGVKYQRMMATTTRVEDQDENDNHHSSYGLSWKSSPMNRLSSEWTPLSSRSSPFNHQDRQNPASTEDRLDRLLAEMGSSPPKPSCSNTIQPPLHHQTECWEVSSLETRFHPVHTTITATTLRPCLKNRSNSDSSSSASDQSCETEVCTMDDRCVKVRFDDDRIEQFLTWSRESYDRKGPQPITKLNIREILELKLIKEELGISSTAKSSFSPDSCLLSH